MSLLKFAAFEVLSVERASGDVIREAEHIAATSPFVKQAHRHEFAYDRRPGMIYVRSRAISSRTNDNYDDFPAGEIKKAWRTFIGKPVFVNHHNSNHKRARGFIIDAALHEDLNANGTPDTWVEVLMEVDAVRFPRLAEAVIKGDIARTSMGTDVQYSVCTACGNKAETPADYCRHIPTMKGMKIRRLNAATGRHEETLVAETCYGLGFFENSLLVEQPADPTAHRLGDIEADWDSLPENLRSAKTASRVDGEAVIDEMVRSASLSKTADKYDDMDGVALWLEATGRGLDGVNHGYGPESDNHNRALLREDDLDPSNLDADHRPISAAGWYCDICGQPVNGQTFNGYPAEGDSVRHTGSLSKTADDDQCPYCSGDSLVINGNEWFSDDNTLTYRCEDGHVWRPADPAARRYHGDGPERGVLQPLSPAISSLLGLQTATLLAEAEMITREALSTTALGEVKAPAEVDTLRADRCPVCKDDEAFNGEKCSVCGHVEPPQNFRDPDLTKAKEMDLRQDKAEEAGAFDPTIDPNSVENPGGMPGDTSINEEQGQPDLQCTNCGEIFSAEGDDETDPDQHPEDPATKADADAADPTADPTVPAAVETGDLDELADKSDAELGLLDDEDEEDPEDPAGHPEVVDPTEPEVVDPVTGKPLNQPKGTEDESLKAVQDGETHVHPADPKADPTKDHDLINPGNPEDVDPKVDPTVSDEDVDPIADESGIGGLYDIGPNQTCPICGEGTLSPMEAAATAQTSQDLDDQQVIDPKRPQTV